MIIIMIVDLHFFGYCSIFSLLDFLFLLLGFSFQNFRILLRIRHTLFLAIRQWQLVFRFWTLVSILGSLSFVPCIYTIRI